jgi:ATP-dependent helicase/nuclease subunit B
VTKGVRVLHIFKGRESLHKRREIYQRIALQEHFSTLLTPSQNTLSLEKEYLELTGKQGIFFEEVTSFERMRARLSTEIFSGNELITQSGERILLSQILREKRQELPLLGRAFRREGLLEELRSLFGRFLREGVMPEDLEEVLREESDSLSHRRLIDLHHLYRTYLEKLRDKYFDVQQSVELFEREGHRFSLYSPHSIWILGFKSLGLPEIRMLQAMEAHTGAIYLSLPCEEEELYAPILEFIHRLKSYFTHVTEETISSPDTPLVQFARGVTGLRYRKEPFPVSVLEARDPYSEAEYIGLDILRRMREDKTLRPEDVRILSPDLTQYGPVFSDVFSTLEIPLFRDERRLILHTRLIKAVFSLLRAMQRGFPAEMTLNYLKNIVPPNRWDELDVFENIVLKEGITKEGFSEPFSDEVEALRADYLSLPIAFAAESLPSQATMQEYCAMVLELLERLNFSAHIDEEAQEYQESAHFEEAMVLSQIWNAFYEALEQLAYLSSDEQVSFSRFLTRLQSALGTLSVAIIPPSSSEVALSDLSRSLAAPVRLLYVCGVNEGLLPGDYSRHLLLAEAQREKVAELVPGYTDLPLLREQGEELDFYTQLALTKDHVLLSYALSDIEGNEQLSSLYIDRVIEMSGKEPISGASENYLDEHYWLNETISLRYAMNAYAQKRKEMIHGVRPQTLKDWVQRVHASDSPSPIKRKTGDRLHTSATALETYRACPFRYFLRHDLKAQERKVFRVERADLGNFYHEIVEQVVKDMVLGQTNLDEALDVRVEELLKKKQYAPFRETAASEYFLERAKAVCRFVLEAIRRHLMNTEFLPSKFEQELRLEGENFSLYGIADRIDQKDQYFLLIDYKSGDKSFNISRIFAGIDLQLSLYTMGLESTGMKSIGSFYLRIFEPEGTTDNPKEERLRKMRLSGALLNDIDLAKSIDTTLTEGTSSFVLPVQLNQDGSFSKNSSVLSEEEHRVLLQTVLDHSESYAKNIVLGDISVAPLEIDRQRLPCSYCEFQAVCRFEKTSGKFRSRKVVLSSKEDVRELLQGGEK